MGLKLSTRNCLKGVIREIVSGRVVTEVKVELAPGVMLTSIVSSEAETSLDLKVGDEVYALIKATEVSLAVEE